MLKQHMNVLSPLENQSEPLKFKGVRTNLPIFSGDI